MYEAKGQAELYVRNLPASEHNPPFIIVVDVGHSLELFAEFARQGRIYIPFPDPRTHRIKLRDLAEQEIHERAEEEKRGVIRWLRPEYQNPAGSQAAAATQGALPIEREDAESPAIKAGKSPGPGPCPSKPRASGRCSPITRLDICRAVETIIEVKEPLQFLFCQVKQREAG